MILWRKNEEIQKLKKKKLVKCRINFYFMTNRNDDTIIFTLKSLELKKKVQNTSKEENFNDFIFKKENIQSKPIQVDIPSNEKDVLESPNIVREFTMLSMEDEVVDMMNNLDKIIWT
uniref:Uncharacterized protein n=1 Tax=Rhizophagus irregularis (strain DAOM 181602 / DAOM 197198 / MUCL 43194) TaxID=747089 RepID=U9UG02_RHIID